MFTETLLRILKHIQYNAEDSQRQLAEELSVSLGKVKYCTRAMIDKGFVKVGNLSATRINLVFNTY